jgi:hypothetical protein
VYPFADLHPAVEGTEHMRFVAPSRRSAASAAVIGLLFGMLSALAASPASAHVERPSYWPDPKPDCAVAPCAGGAVPTIRTLASSLATSKPGVTRVVCQPDSLSRVEASITKARKYGYNIRPTDHQPFSAGQATSLLDINKKLKALCKYDEIQAAVTASGNNDRVVVMPGLYTEPTARSQPTIDPKCDKYRTESDSGDPGALSHDYQLNCPNDANLIGVIGRAADTGPLPAKPLANRHGIPNVGKCIRCNVQLEGSGVSADDVIVEAGDAKAGNGGPSAVGHAKHVGIFVDRADGFVLRNMTVRHAKEHDIYVMETDGYVLDRFKAYYAGGYGVLTFVEDHGLVQNCEAAGNGDSGLYPGSGADSTFEDRYKPFYPQSRYSQVFRLCDSHHNTGGFSGTDSHGTLITQNNFYDNALGYTTDVFTAPGHPGFPQHGNVIEKNNFYSNNFNPFQEGSDVEPFIAAPVGTGLWLAGGNSNLVRDNHFYDNWRRGTMLFAVPDATVCGPPPVGSSTPVPGCNVAGISTSFDNKQYNNTMGVDKDGKYKPNGVDFWWDAFPLNTGNCWWGNKAYSGKKVTTSPEKTPLLGDLLGQKNGLPDCNNGKNSGGALLNLGNIGVLNEVELVACLAGFTVAGYPAGDPSTCTWTATPPKPSGSTSTASARSAAAVSSASPSPSASPTEEVIAASDQEKQQAAAFADICAQGLAPRLCKPFKKVLGAPEFALSLVAKKAAAKAESKATDEAADTADAKPSEATNEPLSDFTCSWWRKANDSDRLGMVQRIGAMATGRVDGTKAVGYGAGLSDERAIALFNDRCSMFQAGPFALYKIYGAAAPFAAMTR